jgi:hypothetical protein
MNTPTERERLQVWTLTLAAVGAAASLAGCSPPTVERADTPGHAQSRPDYRPAPELTGAQREKDGAVILYGLASPGAAVQLASRLGGAEFATADPKGVWRVRLAPSASPRLFGLSMADRGDVVHAVDFLFLGPDGTVARLKSGGGSQALAPAAASPTLDYDNKWAATLSGAAPPGETITLRVDGVERGQATADSGGRYTVPLAQPLSAGAHDFDLEGPKGEARFSAMLDPPGPLTDSAFAAVRRPDGWRVDWITPGGGEQTTLVLDHASGGG